MSEPKPIQLALQGGGAKIVHLVAALEAVEKLQNVDRVLHVTRIAGTSAGAIAGGLFAAGVPMASVKEALASFGKDLARLPRPGFVRFGSNVVARNRTIGDPRVVEEPLNRLLKGKAAYINDLKVPTFIVSADLTTGKSFVADPGDYVVQAMLDSSALPFYFRLWNHSRGHLVDGGICENLPVEKLKTPDKNKFGPIVAISFSRPQAPDLDGIKNYLLALVDAAIHNSEERSLQHLVPDHIFPIDSAYGTFDFEQALSPELGLGDSYDLTRERASSFFGKFIDAQGSTVVGDLWAAQNPDTMHKLALIYRDQHAPFKQKVTLSSLTVQANCLLKNGEALHGTPDFVTYRRSFHTLDEPVYCQKLGFTSAPNSRFLGQASVRATGPDGRVIQTSLVPVANLDDFMSQAIPEAYAADMGRNAVVFFHPPLPRNTGPYTVLLEEYIEDAMARLKARAKDDLFIGNHERAEGDIGRLELIIKVPRSYGAVTLVPAEGARNPGRLMTDAELHRHLGPNSFLVKGWVQENGDRTAGFQVDIYPA
jgi:NTE family protein